MKFRFYAIKLSGIITLVFLAQIIFPGLTDLFLLSQKEYFEMWRFLTAIFLHGSVIHLIYNLFALLLFGSILEKFIGGKKLLLVFFSSGILANIIAVNFYDTSLGASGAIFGVIGALIIIRPMLTVWAFGLPMPIFVAGILWGAGDFLSIFGFGQAGIGNIAHLSGMFFGFLFGAVYKERGFQRRKEVLKLDDRIVREWEDRYLR